MSSESQQSWIYGSMLDDSSCHQIHQQHHVSQCSQPISFGSDYNSIHATDGLTGSYYPQPPSCCLITDSSSPGASQFTYSQSSQSSSYSHQQHYQQHQIHRSNSHDSYSCNPPTSSTHNNIISNIDDSTNNDSKQSSSSNGPRASPELQRAVVKLTELMASFAKTAVSDPNKCVIRFAVDDVLPQINLKRRRFYVISNVLSAIGRITHTKQKTLLWRHSDDLVNLAISQMYVEAVKYVNANRLAQMTSSSTVVSLDDRTIIDIPGEGRGLLNFDDIKQPSWVVENTRKSQLSATQRLLMLCLVAGSNNSIAFNMDRQVYDICRVLIATGVIAEVSPDHTTFSRRVVYRYSGPDVSFLSRNFPCQPVRAVLSANSKRRASAPLPPAHPKEESIPPRLHVSPLEAIDVKVDGELIPRGKVERILHQLGVSGGCGIAVSLVGGSSPNSRRRQGQLHSLVESRLSPGSLLCSPPGKRKRKTSVSDDNWRQLRLDECRLEHPPASTNCWLTKQDEDFLLDAVGDITGFFDDQESDTLHPEILDFALFKRDTEVAPPSSCSKQLKPGVLQSLPVNVYGNTPSSSSSLITTSVMPHKHMNRSASVGQENRPGYYMTWGQLPG